MATERQVVDPADRFWGEHVFRYNAALRYIKQDDIVLDMACGTGFGSNIIAEMIKGKVIGVDIDAQVIAECNRHWKHDNLEFKIMDGTRLEFPDGFFHKVVSFETIEHTRQYRDMIKEFARVLKPEGQLILSTPNKDVSSPDGIVRNAFHEQEFTIGDVKKLLAPQFADLIIMGQRYIRYDKRSIRTLAGKFCEKFMLGFGVRKFPFKWRNGFMKTFFNFPLYPQLDEFALEINKEKIIEDCSIQFVVCKKRIS